MNGLKEAFSRVMQGQGGAPAGGPADDGESVVMPRTPIDKNPMTQDGETIFIDPSLGGTDKKYKKGDEIMLHARVDSVGSKIGLTPLEICDTNDTGIEQTQEETD